MSLSPMMQQYAKIKEDYPDTILLYRLGDFYEMFFEDAVTASRVLELTLTGRDCGLEERAPMCGVPHHAVEGYIAKLLDKGYKVAICEQVTKPGEQKGIVLREVTREITAGTKIDSEMLDETRNNYLMSIFAHDGAVGVSWVDISTGEFKHLQIEAQIALHLNELISRISPSEIICNAEMLAQSINLSVVKFGGSCPFSAYEEAKFDYDNALTCVKENLKDFKTLDGKKLCICSAGALLSYLIQTQKRVLKHVYKAENDDENRYVSINANARKTLELTATSDGKTKGSLYWFLNHTSTPMGARLLRKWIEMPTLNYSEIRKRQDCVDFLVNNSEFAAKLRANMEKIRDLERLSARASYGSISPKESRAAADSLAAVEELKVLIRECPNALIAETYDGVADFTELSALLCAALVESPPVHTRDGGIIADGFDEKLDEYRLMKKNSRACLDKMAEYEREVTGIKNLKIAYNRVFGYYIEVPNSQSSLVPYRYVRRQTIANGERYVTDELKRLESDIINSEENARLREIALFEKLVERICDRIEDILNAAKRIAYFDCILSLALVSENDGYVRPRVGEDVAEIKILEGRHCVVEKLLRDESFVPNDTYLNNSDSRTMLITGPNMAGKSIYMRQVALIVVMAHLGCYVPAKSADISPVDKIFTRVGASDDLSTGRSTFMVEMSEVADILEGVTDNSLLLLDEIGRGTATFDGLSIAWSIIEYLTKNTKAKTLFSTHYHELTELEGVYDGLKNYKMTVREFKGNIIFMRKLMRGSANKSFGIEVAGLAGLPQAVLTKAKELLKKLENSDVARKERENNNYQLSIFSNNSNNEIITILKELDIEEMSPRKALDVLYDLKEKLDNDRN